MILGKYHHETAVSLREPWQGQGSRRLPNLRSLGRLLLGLLCFLGLALLSFSHD
jgi:hypothetical protein